MSVVWFDFETGGLLPQSPNIQLAAVAVGDDWTELGTFECKIAFDPASADPEALRLNHYSAEAWKDSVTESDVVAQFTKFLKNHSSIEMVSKRTGQPYSVARLAGHNAATFDGPRLKAAYERYKAFLPAHPLVLCTLQRAMWWFFEHNIKIESLKLESVCKHFGIEIPEAHDALADCRASIAIAKAMRGGV